MSKGFEFKVLEGWGGLYRSVWVGKCLQPNGERCHKCGKLFQRGDDVACVDRPGREVMLRYHRKCLPHKVKPFVGQVVESPTTPS